MRIELVQRIDSTNAELMRRARQGAAPSLAVMAAEQTAGRGQPGRSWHSPRGGLYLSVLAADGDPSGVSPAIRAGLAVGSTLRALSGRSVRLKWPNDCYLAGAKLAGILVERAPRGLLVAGVGVNIGPQVADGRTGLDPQFAPGKELHHSAAWVDLGHTLAVALDSALRTARPAARVIQEWQAISLLPRQVRLPDGSSGTATGLNLDGSLCVVRADGTDVHIMSSAGLVWPGVGAAV